jgi:quinolinate synthase
VRVVETIPRDREIIFTPDRNLGSWVAKQSGRELILWPGFCPTHDLIEGEDVERARAEHPGAKVVVHPEARPEVTEVADAVESTAGMIRFCRDDPAEEFVIGTETGMIYRLSQDIPGKRFYPVTKMAVCPNMKLTTLEKVRDALVAEAPVVTVPPEVREKALLAVQRMLEVTP